MPKIISFRLTGRTPKVPLSSVNFLKISTNLSAFYGNSRPKPSINLWVKHLSSAIDANITFYPAILNYTRNTLPAALRCPHFLEIIGNW